jgi:threonine dehydrogenase-like Zn-dependent dehydrogenase
MNTIGGYIVKASILIGPAQSEIVNMPLPEINDDEVLIEVSACGVCASELHSWENGTSGKRKVLGHEPVGIIRNIGKNVEGFDVGERVTGLIHEAFAEYTKADYRNIVKVPEDLDDLEALGEPLSCLISGANRTPVQPGDTVAIIGTGFMGLGFMQLMRLKGAGKIIVIDVRQEGLDNALRFGADIVMFPDQVEEQYKVVEWDQMDRGVDVVVEASGSQAGLKLAGEMTKVHGVLSVVGYHQANQGMRDVNMQLWNWKAITVVNAHERRNQVHVDCMNGGLAMINQNLYNMKEMMTHEFNLEEVDQAYGALKNKPSGFIKAVIKMK